MSNIIIELFDPSTEEIKHYDDVVLKHTGLISHSLYHEKRKIRGIYTVSYKYSLGEPLFIIDSSEKDLLEAIGFDTINCNCNKNDLKKETGLSFHLEIIRIKKSMSFNEKYKKNIAIYSSEEIDNAFLTEYIPPTKSLRELINDWRSTPVWIRIFFIFIPGLLLSTNLSKFLTTKTLQTIGIVISFILFTPFFLDSLNFFLKELIGNQWAKITFCIIFLNICSFMLPLLDVKKVKGSKKF